MTEIEKHELRSLILLAADKSDPYRVASCNGKAPFDSAHMARQSIRHDWKGRAMPYRCRFCNKWHVGSHVGPKSRNDKPKSSLDVDA